MSLTERELWTALHGMIFGAIFLLAFSGGLAGLYSLRPEWVTVSGIAERIRRLSETGWAAPRFGRKLLHGARRCAHRYTDNRHWTEPLCQV